MCCSAVATRLAGRENDSSVVVELAIYRGLVRVGCARDILLSLALLSFFLVFLPLSIRLPMAIGVWVSIPESFTALESRTSSR